MILLDSNVIIQFWKSPSPSLKNVFLNNDLAICGIVKAELLHGARSQKEIQTILEALIYLENLEINENDWVGIGKLLNKLKINGITVPFQDAVLSFLSIKNTIPILTFDKHFFLLATSKRRYNSTI